MRFVLIDKITSIEIEKPSQIKTIKNVSLSEEYLADHFPTFPVLPGVLLLQGLIESASWLIRETQDFSNSMILLSQAKNVKYKNFVAPGGQIEYTVQAKTIEDNLSTFKGVGSSGGSQVVEARLELRHFNLADKDPSMAPVDAQIIKNLKSRRKLLK